MAMEERKAKKERGGGGGRWEALSTELLGEICTRLAADETSRAVPFVCRAWRDVVMGPYCWAAVDVQQWCRRVDRTDVIDATVRRLVRRSRGSVQRLSAFKLGDSAFCYAAQCGRCLKVLRMPMSEVTDEMVERHAPLLTELAELDISYCLKITHNGIEAFGKHCRSLVHLSRNMPPPEIEYGHHQDDAAANTDDHEALAVAGTMPGLRHLELAFSRLGDHGLDAIVANCRALCVLDVRGCWGVKMEGNLEDRCNEIPEFRVPWEDDYEDTDSGENGVDGNAGLVDDDSDWE